MQTIQSAKHFTVVFCILFLLTVVLFNSCKKNDAIINSNETNKIVNTKKFFDLPANVNSTVARVANALAQQNEKTGFINELASTAGYPVWGKSTVKLIKGNTTTTSNSLLEDYEGGDTCILIPMVLEDGVYVNAFISAVIIDDSVTMRLYYKNDYKAYPFKATQPTTSVTTAEEFATQMMLFDEAVFGYTAFQLKDKRLFHTGTNYSDTAGTKVEIEINSNSPTGGGNNLIFCTETEIFISYCTTPLASQCIPSCDGCGAPTCWTITVTQENCTGSPQMPGGGGWPSAPPPNGPGGGGSGGGNPPGECQVGGLIENGFAPPNPCNPGGGNPLPPVPPPPAPPCDPFIDSLQKNVEFNGKISYLEQDSVFDKSVETGFTGVLSNNNAGKYAYAQGETVSNGIGIINFYKPQYFTHGPVDVIMHCHADNGANVNLNCIFSPSDVTFMASNLLNGTNMYNNNSNFVFVVTAKGVETNTGNPKVVTYMLKVTDLQAFQNFAIANTGANGNDGDIMEDFKTKHNYKFKNKNIPNSEREFLKMLKVNANGVGSGLSLYKANNTATGRKWTRLNLDGNTVTPTNCF